MYFVNALGKLEMDISPNFKAIRMQQSQKASPIRILFYFQKLAKDLLKRKKKLNESNVKIKSKSHFDPRKPTEKF